MQCKYKSIVAYTSHANLAQCLLLFELACSKGWASAAEAHTQVHFCMNVSFLVCISTHFHHSLFMQCAPILLCFFLSRFCHSSRTSHLISALLFNMLHCVLLFNARMKNTQTHSNSNNQFINSRMEIHFRSWNISWCKALSISFPEINSSLHVYEHSHLSDERPKHIECQSVCMLKRCSVHLMSFFWKFPGGFFSSFIFWFRSMLHGKFLNKVFAMNVAFLLCYSKIKERTSWGHSVSMEFEVSKIIEKFEVADIGFDVFKRKFCWIFFLASSFLKIA